LCEESDRRCAKEFFYKGFGHVFFPVKYLGLVVGKGLYGPLQAVDLYKLFGQDVFAPLVGVDNGH